jgi:hypothetical protein
MTDDEIGTQRATRFFEGEIQFEYRVVFVCAGFVWALRNAPRQNDSILNYAHVSVRAPRGRKDQITATPH